MITASVGVRARRCPAANVATSNSAFMWTGSNGGALHGEARRDRRQPELGPVRSVMA